jgi:hypothetical protein
MVGGYTSYADEERERPCMHRRQTLEEHAREQDRHIGHLAVQRRRSALRKRHDQPAEPTKSYGRGRERFTRRISSDKRAMRFEARAEVEAFWDGYTGFDDFVEPQFGSQLINALLGANPRLIVAHSQDVRLNLVDEFAELLDFEEQEAIDPAELAEAGFHYVTV